MKRWIDRNKIIVIVSAFALLGFLLVFLNSAENKAPISAVNTPEKTEEQRIKALIETIDGVEDATVLVTFKSNEDVRATGSFYSSVQNENDRNNIKGIAISTRGGDNILLCEKIKSLICAAYDISDDMIYICGK